MMNDLIKYRARRHARFRSPLMTGVVRKPKSSNILVVVAAINGTGTAVRRFSMNWIVQPLPVRSWGC